MKLIENTLDVFFPLSGEAVVSGQNPNRQFIGTGISFCIHAIVVCGVFFLGPSLADFRPPLVIDFSIEQSRAPAKIKEIVPPVEKPEPLVRQPVREEVVLPEAAPPEKAEVVETPKIVPVETKKKIVEERIPEPVVQEEIETEPEEIIAEQKEPSSAQVIKSTPPPRPEDTALFKRQRYYKEHFQYIQDNVQSKITYPRIARKMGWQGRVLISFIICLDGTVKDVQVLESSGHKALDRNAVEVVQKVAPFPKPPVAAELIIPVVYSLI